jgi:hypothetical protein
VLHARRDSREASRIGGSSRSLAPGRTGHKQERQTEQKDDTVPHSSPV